MTDQKPDPLDEDLPAGCGVILIIGGALVAVVVVGVLVKLIGWLYS